MRSLAVFSLLVLLSGCGGLSLTKAPSPAAEPAPSHTLNEIPEPRIEVAAKPLQCVPFARQQSGISIYGDAWTWWGKAEGHYKKGSQPRAGSVLVLKQRGHSLGHLAVVRRVISDREIIADHANWLNEGNIHWGTPIFDVSVAGDWSEVRVWYTPGNHLGGGVYPSHGFIEPATEQNATALPVS